MTAQNGNKGKHFLIVLLSRATSFTLICFVRNVIIPIVIDETLNHLNHTLKNIMNEISNLMNVGHKR